MPNWCYTNYVVEGDRKDIADLHAKMVALQNMQEPYVPNGFGPTWLGCLINKLGGDWNKIYCRGSWSELEIYPDGTLRFNTETAWYRMDEVEAFLKSKYKSLRIYFYTEEEGMEIFETNDVEGKYFSDTVVVDSEQEGTEYFTEDEAVVWLSHLLKRPFKNLKTAMRYVEVHNDYEDESDGEDHIWVHKIEYINLRS